MKKNLKSHKGEKEDAIVKVFFSMNETIIEGRFKKLLGISTFGNGDSKKDTDTTLKMIKKTGLFTMPWGPFHKK